ncbi:MAG TPA: hypothetical protein VKD69_18290, partial [Vicinamibacterales bacterium]|nr:hypothetical protein [Vicinamibacterales bacterium]
MNVFDEVNVWVTVRPVPLVPSPKFHAKLTTSLDAGPQLAEVPDETSAPAVSCSGTFAAATDGEIVKHGTGVVAGGRITPA